LKEEHAANESEYKIRTDQAREFVLTTADSIAEHIKNHQAEYRIFLLNEKEGGTK